MTDKRQLDVKILYLACHNSLKKIYGLDNEISRKVLWTKLGRQYLVSQDLREAALREFELMGLIKRVDRNNIILLDFQIDIESEPHKLIEKLKLETY